MIEPLIKALREAGFESDHIDVADMLWLAHGMHQHADNSDIPDSKPIDPVQVTGQSTSEPAQSRPPSTPQKPVETAQRRRTPRTEPHAAPVGTFTSTTPEERIVAPTSPALPERLNIARALRPFKRRRNSDHFVEFDIDATVRRYADTGFLYPVMRPGRERWFDVALVIDESMSMIVWEETVDELIRVFDRQGAFRDVHRWSLREEAGRAMVYNDTGLPAGTHNLVDPGGNRLVLMVTDCVAELWYRPKIWRLLQQWGKRTPVAILHMLPTRIWPTTGLGAANIAMYGARPGAPNSAQHASLPFWLEPPHHGLEAVPIPAISLQAAAISDWARVTMGVGTGSTRAEIKTRVTGHYPGSAQAQKLSADAQVEVFRTHVSQTTWELTTYLSVVPLRLGLMRLVQEAMLPHSGHAELAEFLIGGLVRRISGEQRILDGQDIEFEFVDGVREVLNRAVDQAQTLKVYRAIAQHLERTTGSAPGFTALILGKDLDKSALPDVLRPFVSVSEGVFERVGLRSLTPPAPPEQSTEDTAQGAKEQPAELAPTWDAALVVGVSHYEHLDPLDDPAQTAVEFGEWLCSTPGPNVPKDRLRVLQNPGSAGEIQRAFIDLYANTPSFDAQSGNDRLFVLAFFGHTVKGEHNPVFCLPAFNPEQPLSQETRLPVGVFDYRAILSQLMAGGHWQRYLCLVDGGPDDVESSVRADPFQQLTEHIVQPSPGDRSGLELTRKTYFRENFLRTIMDAFNHAARDVDGYLRQDGLVNHLTDAVFHESYASGLGVILDDTSVIEPDAHTDKLPDITGFSAALIVSSGDEETLFGASLITTWLRHPGGFDMNPALVEQLYNPTSYQNILNALQNLDNENSRGGTLFVYLTGTLVPRNNATYFQLGDRLPQPELELTEFYKKLCTLRSFSNVALVVDGQTREIDDMFPAIPSQALEQRRIDGVLMIARDWPLHEFARAFIHGFRPPSPTETGDVTHMTMHGRLMKIRYLELLVDVTGELPFGPYQPEQATEVQVLSRRSTFTCEHGRGVVRLPKSDGPLTLHDLENAPIDGCTITGDSGKHCTKVVGVGESGAGGLYGGQLTRCLFDTVEVISDGASARFDDGDNTEESADSYAHVLLDQTRYVDLARFDPPKIYRNDPENVDLKWPVVSLSIKMFATRTGCSVLIRRPRLEQDNHLLFDVGGDGDYRRVLRPFLEKFSKNDSNNPLFLDAMAISELSETNANAIRNLFDDIIERREEARTPLLQINDVWYNTTEELELDQGVIGSKIRRPERHFLSSLNVLDISRNRAFGGTPAVRHSDTPQRIEVDGGLVVSVLGPRPPPVKNTKLPRRLSSLHQSGLILLVECDDRLVLLTGDAKPQSVIECTQDVHLGENGNEVDVFQLPNPDSSGGNKETLFHTEQMLKSVIARQYLVSGSGHINGCPDLAMLRQLLELRQDRPFVVNLAMHPEQFSPDFPISELLNMFESHSYAQLLHPDPGETFHTVDLLASLPLP